MSIAVWVGLIALLGVDAETAVFMLLYLDIAFHEAQKKGEMRNWDDLREAIINGAVKRLRPKIMTVACMLFALLPILWSVGSLDNPIKKMNGCHKQSAYISPGTSIKTDVQDG